MLPFLEGRQELAGTWSGRVHTNLFFSEGAHDDQNTCESGRGPIWLSSSRSRISNNGLKRIEIRALRMDRAVDITLPVDAARSRPIKAASRVNAVRVPLNEDCWLGINLPASNPCVGKYGSRMSECAQFSRIAAMACRRRTVVFAAVHESVPVQVFGRLMSEPRADAAGVRTRGSTAQRASDLVLWFEAEVVHSEHFRVLIP
jgi:hypothetical protein